jgi:hypothetical protein
MSIGPTALQPGTHVTFSHRTAEGERFAPGAFASRIGKLVPITMEDATIATARILSIDVSSDGSAVSVTYEITDVYPPV